MTILLPALLSNTIVPSLFSPPTVSRQHWGGLESSVFSLPTVLYSFRSPVSVTPMVLASTSVPLLLLPTASMVYTVAAGPSAPCLPSRTTGSVTVLRNVPPTYRAKFHVFTPWPNALKVLTVNIPDGQSTMSPPTSVFEMVKYASFVSVTCTAVPPVIFTTFAVTLTVSLPLSLPVLSPFSTLAER